MIVRYVICKYFLPLCGLPLCFLDGVLCTEVFILIKSSVSVFFFFLLLLALLPYSRMVIFTHWSVMVINIACSGNNSLLPPLQKLTGKLPESAGIRANVPKVLN